MQIKLTLFAMFLGSAAYAETCTKIIDTSTDQSTILVECANLEELDQPTLKASIRTIFRKYDGPPDETVIHFVRPNTTLRIANLDALTEDYVAWYYTHCDCGEYWPADASTKKEFTIQR